MQWRKCYARARKPPEDGQLTVRGNDIVHSDPRDVLLKSPMTAMQILIVAITVGLNALDGFDVLSISFASPGIRAEWGLGPTALGFVLSAELIGMALGSIFLGGVADKIGRRPTVLGCLVVMATGMFMATTSSGVLGGFVTPVFAAVRRRGRSAARGSRDLARHHGARHRRHARGDQRRRRGILERAAPGC